jgi:hypothetical protein
MAYCVNGCWTVSNAIGIGTETPSQPIEIRSSQEGLWMYRDGGASNDIRFRSSNGTNASPTAKTNGELMGQLHFEGYDGSSYLSFGGIWSDLDGTVSTGNMPTTLRFFTGTTSRNERMRITSGGNVGIGTTSPSSKLDVSGADGRIQSRVDSSDGSTINIRPNAGKCGWISYTENAVADRWGIGVKNGDAKLYFASGNVGIDGGTTRMVLDGSGNVGIGITSPASRFHITHTSSQGACTIILQTTDTCANGTISWRSCAGVTQAQIGSNYNVGDNSGNLEFITSGNTRLLVTSGGNIGMGTTSPSYRLHVNGTFYAAGSSQDYKEGICQYSTDSCLFMCLKPKTYQYKDEWKHLGKDLKSGIQIGLIAEEVAESHPELAVLVNEEDNQVVRNVDYEKLSIILLAEVQKLRQEVDQLNQK